MHTDNTRVLVIGAGLAGMSTALLLADAFPAWQITLVGNAPLTQIDDPRTLVLMARNYQQLSQAGLVLDPSKTTELQTTEVRLHGHALPITMNNYPTVVRASEVHNKLADAIVARPAINFVAAEVNALDTTHNHIKCKDGTTHTADLLCLCAGSNELVHFAHTKRHTDYHTCAWVFRCYTSNSNAHNAIIDIDSAGHIALLPAISPEYTTGVITRSNTLSTEQVSCDLTQWLAEHKAELLHLGTAHPLIKRVSAPLTDEATVLLGHAAHQVHPIGAQGFNLTMRTLAMLIHSLQTHNTISAALLNYQSTALPDILRVLERTHLLATLSKHTLLRTPMALFSRLARRFPHQAEKVIQQIVNYD